MSTQRMTLSFLTESKASHVGITSMRRVVITLLVMLLTTVSVWAQFSPTIYRLSLNDNYQGGGIATVDVPISNPTTYTLTSADEPTREGYTFGGWSTSSTGKVQYCTNDQITLTGNMTLYAVWDNNPYTLTLNPNYEGGASEAILVSYYSPTYTLTQSDVPTREGHTFYGWSETPTGDIEYVTGNVVTLSGNLTLYAIWDKTYTLTLVANYEGGASTMISVPFLSRTYTLSESVVPIREGHTFKGWSVTSTGPYQYSTGDIMTLTDNLTLYAIWDDSPCPFKLAYTITNENQKQVQLSGYEGDKPEGSLNIPANITIDGISYSVTSIGNVAFMFCHNLQSVTIPNSVTSIGNSAFDGCSGLTSITIPNSVTSIGEFAFANCPIVSLTIGMNDIGSEFQGFSSLKSVTILDGVTGIGNSAFNGCVNLESVTIPNSVTSIGYEAFYDCSSLASITIPNSVTSIGSSAFSGCSSLQSVTIPNSVTNIRELTFAACSNLQSVTIPNSVTSIGYNAFEKCSSLESVTIPNSVTSIGSSAFSGCSNLESVTIPNSVTSIGSSAFSGCSNLESVTIPNSVTSIGGAAFSGCSSLQSVTIPNSVTNIRELTFAACSNLQSVTIPNSVTSIGYSAFEKCSSLESVTIPNSVTSIGENAFAGCPITSLTIGMENIGSDFKGFSSLKSVTILDGVTSIGYEAFYDCSSLASITIPNSVTSIWNAAFYGCSSLKSVTIPNSVTSIGDRTFSGCSSLESVTIPNSVTSIGYGAFADCNDLQSITIPNSVTRIDGFAFENSGLTSITIPNSMTSIGGFAFSGCGNLTSVTIPNSVTSIGDCAFASCGLTSVNIPNSVTSIDDFAFADCYDLTSITLNSNPRIGVGVFGNTPATVTMNLTASNIDGTKWTTFYNDGYNFEADGHTTVYKATVDGSSLVLTEVADRIVDSGTAVILKSTGNPVMTLTDSESSDTNGNDLRGIGLRSLRTKVMNNNGANAIYTMGNTSAGFGFHKYTGEYVPGGKAFLPLNTSNGAKAILTMVFADMTTGVKSVSSDNEDLQNDWYSLDGTRLNGKPTQHGIYINGNKKVVVR